MTSLDLATRFLTDLFEFRSAVERIVIWTRQDKVTQFFDCPDTAAKYAIDRAASADVYTGVGTVRADVTAGRGRTSDVLALHALWSDVDYGPPRGGKTYPPTIQTAHEVIGRMELPPSLVIHSGHGLQPWWLLSEPMTEKMSASARGWGLTLQAHAASLGYCIDSVHDITRVMRVPGTLNHKDETPLPVTLAGGAYPSSPRRYDWDDLSGLLVCEQVMAGSESLTHVDAVVLKAGSCLNSNKLQRLLDADSRFRRTWDHSREDMKDQSPSGYDLALANFGVTAGLTDQEIADLVVQFRERHKLGHEKALRRDYMMRTIAAAKSAHRSSAAVSELVLTPPNGGTNIGEDDERREKILINVSNALGTPIKRWIQDGIEAAEYRMILESGRSIVMGRENDVTNQRTFRSKLYGAVAMIPPALKGPVWDKLLNALGSVVEVRDNPEGGRVNRLAGWMDAYLSVGPRTVRDEEPLIADAIRDARPFVMDGKYHISARGLRQFISTSVFEKVEINEVWSCLRASGFEQVKVAASDGDGNKRWGRYWSVSLAGAPEVLGLDRLKESR